MRYTHNIDDFEEWMRLKRYSQAAILNYVSNIRKFIKSFNGELRCICEVNPEEYARKIYPTHVSTGRPALITQIRTYLRFLIETNQLGVCAASDCERLYVQRYGGKPRMYCSSQCRDRMKHRKYRRERAEKGLCPQCGKEMDQNEQKALYCSVCSQYFKKYHKKKKID